METMQDKTLTVEEVERRYPNEWVLLESIHAHKHHPRVKGRLLAHSSNREELDEPFERFRQSTRAHGPTSSTPATSCPRTGTSS